MTSFFMKTEFLSNNKSQIQILEIDVLELDHDMYIEYNEEKGNQKIQANVQRYIFHIKMSRFCFVTGS